MFRKLGTIKIMGHGVDVFVTNDPMQLTDLDGGVVLGVCRCDLCRIILDADLSTSQLQSLLFHELCEFVQINSGANYANEHDYFSAFNNLLWGEIRNNQEWLFGKAIEKALNR